MTNRAEGLIIERSNRPRTHSPVAQLAEQVAVNHRVGGSNPSWGASDECNPLPNRLLNLTDKAPHR